MGSKTKIGEIDGDDVVITGTGNVIQMDSEDPGRGHKHGSALNLLAGFAAGTLSVGGGAWRVAKLMVEAGYHIVAGTSTVRKGDIER